MGLFSGITKAVKGVAGFLGGSGTAGVISTGLSLLGGNKGGGSTTSRINFEQLRDDAIKAGFNPLTALTATGGAGHTTTTGPSLSSSGFISEALNSGLQMWSNVSANEKDAEMESIKKRLAQEELNAAIRANSLPPQGGYFGHTIPTYSGPGVSVSGTRAERDGPALKHPNNWGTDSTGLGTNNGEGGSVEDDAYHAGRNGQFQDWSGELIRRNLPEFFEKPLFYIGKNGQEIRPKFGPARPPSAYKTGGSRLGEFPGAW
ncbi:hypothetical protein [Tortoise microvirus 81]|nr:hypothetical protein [Tortoise microvirus 81]